MTLVLLALFACHDDKPATDVQTPAATPSGPTTPAPDAPAATPAPETTEVAPGVTNAGPRIPSTNTERMAASHILVVYRGALGALPNVKRTREEAKARAEEALAKVQAGASFAETAKAYSDDPSSSRGGYLGGFGRGVMVEAFENAVRGLQPGQLDPVVVESQFGFHVIRREPLAEVHAAHLLVTWKGADRAPSGINRSKDEAKARIEEAIAKLKSGAAWNQVVGQYSDSPMKDDGGDLSWVGRGQLGKPLEDAVFDLAPGTVSDVIETPIGYHLVRRVE